VHLVLVTTAIVNLFTKSIATVAGISFAFVFFIVFSISERVNRRKFEDAAAQMKEHFQLLHRENLLEEAGNVRPGNILVTVRDYNTLMHLKWILQRTDTNEQDVVVMEARLVGPGAAEYDLSMEQIFSEYEQTLFTRAVSIAEGVGKRISLLVVPARDVWSAIVQTATQLRSSVVVAGLSSKMTPQEQAFNLGRGWEQMSEPKQQFIFQVVRPDGEAETYTIGPHTPSLKPEDIQLTHRLWLNFTRSKGLEKLHHADIISLALTRLARDYGRDRDEILNDLTKVGREKRFGPPVALPDVPPPPAKPVDGAKEPPSPPVISP
jgi:hypothetical protein